MKPTEKITKKFDKLIMGAIIGGAIGSVLGLTLAPKKGSETRQIIKDKSKEVYEKGRDLIVGEKRAKEKISFWEKWKNKFLKQKKNSLEMKKIPMEQPDLTVEEEDKASINSKPQYPNAE